MVWMTITSSHITSNHLRVADERCLHAVSCQNFDTFQPIQRLRREGAGSLVVQLVSWILLFLLRARKLFLVIFIVCAGDLVAFGSVATDLFMMIVIITTVASGVLSSTNMVLRSCSIRDFCISKRVDCKKGLSWQDIPMYSRNCHQILGFPPLVRIRGFIPSAEWKSSARYGKNQHPRRKKLRVCNGITTISLDEIWRRYMQRLIAEDFATIAIIKESSLVQGRSCCFLWQKISVPGAFAAGMRFQNLAARIFR